MAKLNAFANNISSTYDSTQPSPFDARQTVETLDDLTKAETWVVTAGGINYYPVYVGMITSVKADKNLYLLEEFEQTNLQTAPTNLVWKKLGESSGAGIVGPTGPTGEAAAVAVRSTNLVNLDSEARVESTQDGNTLMLDFYIPRGAESIRVGNVTTVDAGQNATITDRYVDGVHYLDFSIPRG